ncbi:methyl-accepting chemotaxis protein [Desulforamulus ruminis]|uniref:Chemotaxis sensory transducer n=1 Tax=Desulforamulus ruminis (strain ATCC 23193 / DSM 2154 / NCIMB 8452 / DL) TaxID=696281 RepID=F6DMZ7_DESRL|nr:methyl-accepting chemotaxis protein [Desulforamulus ruminis]AEG59455.1 chemotaxis sensory transducer [Desulforamulus ruminis DSM 2154]
MFQSIRTKMLVPLVILVCVSLVALVLSGYRQMRTAILEQEQVQYRNIESLIRNDLEAVFTSTRMGLASVTAMPGIQEAFAKREREKLLTLTSGVFEQAKKDGIEQFQFHLPPAVSFLRLHQQDKYGDDLSSFRNTVVQCNQSQKVVAGLEEGRGGYGFRVVAPVFYQGQHVGSVEYGMGFNAELLARWKKQLGGDFFMYPYASSGVAWAKVDQSKPLAGTAARDGLTVSPQIIKEAMAGKNYHAVYMADASAVAVIIPVFDYSGKPISYVKANLDRTQVLGQLQGVLRDSLLLLILSILVMAAVMYFVTGKALKPLVWISEEVSLIARGDLTRNFNFKGKDEIAALGQALNTMLSNFRQLIGETRSVSDQLEESSKSLTQSSEETSSAVQEVTTQVTQLAGSLEELGTIARDAAGYSGQASQAAQEGQQAVGQTTEQMNLLHTMMEGLALETGGLGQRIGDIEKFVQLIGEIAEQTNLLALNAAIESARAGEQGRGFAVVAQEIRQLADRSNLAAEDVKAIILEIGKQSEGVIRKMNEGLKEVRSGHRLIDQTGEKFSRIKETVDLLVEQSAAVAEASAQATASGSEIAAATEQQLASIQQVTVAAGLLEQLACNLHQHIGKFKNDSSC